MSSAQPIDPAIDVVACPKCSRETTACQLADEAGHGWDGRHRTYDPRALWCTACGHTWIEEDLDKVAKNWRAEAAHYVNKLRDREATRKQLGLPPTKDTTR